MSHVQGGHPFPVDHFTDDLEYFIVPGFIQACQSFIQAEQTRSQRKRAPQCHPSRLAPG